ncbi:72 kDa type IV collagenase-like isoform X3 [Acropora palmata]|uniref:72 kDa type IV collagenase-like isoform X3 n=1 Tax=Acropora palmata TaxID=6131 RepID=UPI003DA010C9
MTIGTNRMCTRRRQLRQHDVLSTTTPDNCKKTLDDDYRRLSLLYSTCVIYTSGPIADDQARVMIAFSCFLFTFVCLAQSRRYSGQYNHGNQEVKCKTKTTNGKCCSFPFTYKGVTYNSCTKIGHNKLWCSLDTSYKGRWGNCEVECKTKTTNGKCCSFPFTYKGVTYNSCTKIGHNKLWCSLDTSYKGRWGNCEVDCNTTRTDEVECKTKTTNGKCCSFPFTYKGVTYNSCTKIGHNKLWCSLDTSYKGRWGNCEVKCKTKTTNGKCCSFPFTYKGVTYNSCTKIGHNKLWCSLDTSYKGRWGNCEVKCKTKTTNGKCCSFPFTYKGVTYNSCTKIGHNKLWCSLDTSYKGRWGNCVLRPK